MGCINHIGTLSFKKKLIKVKFFTQIHVYTESKVQVKDKILCCDMFTFIFLFPVWL